MNGERKQITKALEAEIKRLRAKNRKLREENMELRNRLNLGEQAHEVRGSPSFSRKGLSDQTIDEFLTDGEFEGL